MDKEAVKEVSALLQELVSDIARRKGSEGSSRMRSFCSSRVIVVTEDIAGRVVGASSGRSAEIRMARKSFSPCAQRRCRERRESRRRR